MIDRRGFFGIAAGAGAGLALTPQLLRAFQQSGGTLIQRSIPSTGEMLPVSACAFPCIASKTRPPLSTIGFGSAARDRHRNRRGP